MSASIDTHGKKRILMIAANPGTSPSTGWPVGFWWRSMAAVSAGSLGWG